MFSQRDDGRRVARNLVRRGRDGAEHGRVAFLLEHSGVSCCNRYSWTSLHVPGHILSMGGPRDLPDRLLRQGLAVPVELLPARQEGDELWLGDGRTKGLKHALGGLSSAL